MHLRCPHCQNPIELADVPSSREIACAGCGSSFHLANVSTLTSQAPAKKRLGKFEILGAVGQGAFGTVLKARDTELDRVVAIKVPRAGNVGSGPEDVDRFLREARAVAQLRFPSIIAIHEVGMDNDTPYLVCDFVAGVTLADLLTGRRLTCTESAQLSANVADALQYAHSLGVVHRDVKPSNIMIRPDGSPCVMDFGLAKRDAGEITMTIDGQILGTPAYMSPEQARGEGHKVDGKSDVYSLGVILYQLLTGELPFRGNKAMLLHQVLHDEPGPPRSLNDKIPRDLETIALKAMAKEPGRRFASAKEMAEDLRRWLAGEPILARPVGTVERLLRWCKRKPALAAANAAVLAALITFAAAFFVVKESLKNEEIERGKAQQLAGEKEKLADNEKKQREKAEKLAGANKKLAIDADERREQAEELALRVEFEHYFSKADERPDVAVVGLASLLPRAGRLKQSTSADRFRLHLASMLPSVARLNAVCGHEGPVRAVALSADGKIALTGSEDKTARLWDAASGKPMGPPLLHQDKVVAVALSADGKIALTGSEDKTARLWDAASGKPMGPPLQHQLLVGAVALSGDGKIALTGSGMAARLWDAVSGKPIGPPLRGDFYGVSAVALSADGRVALTGSEFGDNAARLWDPASGKPIGPPLQHQDKVRAVALSADGKIALTGSWDKTARLWDAASGKPMGPPLQHQSSVGVVSLSADGKIALTRSYDRTRLWDAASGKPIGPPLEHQGWVNSAALSADGKIALTGSADNTARLWEASGKPFPPPLQHQREVHAVALSADGKIALTRSWDLSPELLVATGDTTRLWDVASGKPIGEPLEHRALDGAFGVNHAALSAEGKVALTGGDDNTARLWDALSGKPIGPPLQHQSRVLAVALSADGKIALTGSSDKTARLWDAASGKPIGPHQNSFGVVALSADGKIALTGSAGKTVRLWDAASGKPIGPPLEHQGYVIAVALSADGKTVLTGSIDNTARLWDAASGKPIGQSLKHLGQVEAVALSADGKIALTGSHDDTARLWDAATGKPIGPPLQHQIRVVAVALSADGKIALTGSWDKTARLWEVATSKLIGPPLQHRNIVGTVALSANGKIALTGSWDKTARLWKVPQPIRGDPERIMLWTQVITGLEVDDLTAVRVLDAAAWRERRDRLEKLGGPLVDSIPD